MIKITKSSFRQLFCNDIRVMCGGNRAQSYDITVIFAEDKSELVKIYIAKIIIR